MFSTTKAMTLLLTSLLIFLAIELTDMGNKEGFKSRFKAYKEGKPISEIYDAGLPRYAGGKRGHIGGTTKQARETVWNADWVLSNAVDSIANAYGLHDGALRHRLDQEGFTDRVINLYNAASDQSQYIGENLLNNKYDFSGIGHFGLDDAATMIGNGQMQLKGETWWDEDGENEKGRIIKGAVGDTVRDTIGLQAAALKYFSDEVKKDFPNLSSYDNARYAQAYYQRGAAGGRKWAKSGAKGYNFATKPLAMRLADNPYKITTNIQNTATPKFGSYKNGKLPGFKDGMKYSWNDIEQNWDRYTGDAMGDVFADFVVTPRGGAHKKDIQPLRIVTPEQEQYVEKTQPTISTNPTWHYTPTPQTFAGRVAQAFGGDWKTTDITSSGLSLRPELSIPLGVMDFGYNLNQSVHNLTDTDAHINTALSAAAILPFVGGGLKLLKGKDVGTKILNAYNNYMHSLGNVDDINNTLKNVRYLDSATDAAPAIKATGENPFKYRGDSQKTMDLFKKMRSIQIRGKLAQIRQQQPDLVNDQYGIRDLANDVIHHEGMPEGVEDIFRYQILPRTNISKMNYDNTIGILSRYGYNTLDDYNWAKYVDDNLAGYLDNSTYGIALREPYIRTAGPHEFRHRMQHLVPYKRSLAIDREAYLNRAYDEDFVNLPNVVDESDNLYGYPHMADEKATTNLDARNYAFANFTDDPNIGKMSVTEQNKFLDSLSDDQIIEAVANSNGYGKRYIHFLERKYDMLNNPKTNAQWANKFRNAMKYYGSFALPAAIVASLPEYSNGKSPIHIKPANRGKFTALKKRTGHSASWFKENGTPEQKKMAVFALNAKKWKH